MQTRKPSEKGDPASRKEGVPLGCEGGPRMAKGVWGARLPAAAGTLKLGFLPETETEHCCLTYLTPSRGIFEFF